MRKETKTKKLGRASDKKRDTKEREWKKEGKQRWEWVRWEAGK